MGFQSFTLVSEISVEGDYMPYILPTCGLLTGLFLASPVVSEYLNKTYGDRVRFIDNKFNITEDVFIVNL